MKHIFIKIQPFEYRHCDTPLWWEQWVTCCETAELIYSLAKNSKMMRATNKSPAALQKASIWLFAINVRGQQKWLMDNKEVTLWVTSLFRVIQRWKGRQNCSLAAHHLLWHGSGHFSPFIRLQCHALISTQTTADLRHCTLSHTTQWQGAATHTLWIMNWLWFKSVCANACAPWTTALNWTQADLHSPSTLKLLPSDCDAFSIDSKIYTSSWSFYHA